MLMKKLVSMLSLSNLNFYPLGHVPHLSYTTLYKKKETWPAATTTHILQKKNIGERKNNKAKVQEHSSNVTVRKNAKKLNK